MMTFFRSQRLPRQPRGWRSPTGHPAGYEPRPVALPPREVAPPEHFPQSPLRYRWFGGGYRPEDVQLVLAECRLAVRQLERRVAPLRERERELQEELDRLREELAGLHARRSELTGQVEAALAHAGNVEQLARDQSMWVMHVAEQEPPLPEGTPQAAAMSGKPVNQLMNEELLSSAQTLDAQLKRVGESLRARTAGLPEPEPERSEDVPGPARAPEAAGPEPSLEPASHEPADEREPERYTEPEPLPAQAEIRGPDEPPAVERPAASVTADGGSRRRIAPDVAALREELRAFELRGREEAGRPGYLAALVIGVVAAGLAAAVGLAVAGYATAAVILLAAFALGIAILSVFGIGRPQQAAVSAESPRLPQPAVPTLEAELYAPELEWPEETELEEPVQEFDAAAAQRELAQLARERARRLVELGDAVELVDEDAANRARSRLRELAALISAKEGEIESAARSFDDDRRDAERWRNGPVTNNSQYDGS